jgi:hypothetical protein
MLCGKILYSTDMAAIVGWGRGGRLAARHHA